MHDPTDDRSDGRSDTQTDSEENRSAVEEATHVTLKFQPQRWETHGFDDYAIPTDETYTFTVPIEAITDDNGNRYDEPSYDLDGLRTHPNAPRKVKTWDGPFSLRYHAFHHETDLTGDQVIEHATATVTFYPEIPINGGLSVPDDTWTYTVPARDVFDDNGTLLPDGSEQSDRLAHSEHAPEIVQRWSELTDWCFRMDIDGFRIGDAPINPETFIDRYVEGGGCQPIHLRIY